MDSCARGAFLSGGAFWYHSIGYKPRESATVQSRRSESGLIAGAHTAFQCASAALSSGAKEIDFGPHTDPKDGLSEK